MKSKLADRSFRLFWSRLATRHEFWSDLNRGLRNTRSAYAVTLLFLAVAAFGQDDRATISGQVTDASGAAIPEAKVKAIHKSTNQATEVTANTEGFYTIPYLPPSTYDIEVSANGFKSVRVADVQLHTADKFELPI